MKSKEEEMKKNEKAWKALQDYTANELLTFLDHNEDMDHKRLAYICSEILRREIKFNTLDPEKCKRKKVKSCNN